MSYSRIRRGQMAADRFTQISNALFRDPRISYKAKGIFGFISTHRDGYGVSAETIANAGPGGVSAVRSGLQELERYGYLYMLRHRNPDGTLGAAEYFITDEPGSISMADLPEGVELMPRRRRSQPDAENRNVVDDEETRRSEPECGYPDVDEPHVENRRTKKTSTKKTSVKKTIHPSVGSTAEAGTDGGTDGEQQQSQTKPQAPVQVPDTAGVQLLQAIGRHRPELMFVGETLRDQGGNVDELLRRGWTAETLWGIITQPLPQRMTKGPAAIISGRLTKALASPVPQAMPAPRDAWDDAEGERWDAPTPTPDRYRAGDDPVSRRWIDCPGRDGLCPNLVPAEGDLCPGCAPQPAAAAF